MGNLQQIHPFYAFAQVFFNYLNSFKVIIWQLLSACTASSFHDMCYAVA